MSDQNLFQLGDFTLAGGTRSGWKIDCDALTDGDWRALAEMVRLLAGPYRAVVGVPRGGLALAKHLEPFAGLAGPLLIVDDVLTTGGSMERAKVESAGLGRHEKDVIGVVVFARGQCPYWVRPLFKMPEPFWPKPLTR